MHDATINSLCIFELLYMYISNTTKNCLDLALVYYFLLTKHRTKINRSLLRSFIFHRAGDGAIIGEYNYRNNSNNKFIFLDNAYSFPHSALATDSLIQATPFPRRIEIYPKTPITLTTTTKDPSNTLKNLLSPRNKNWLDSQTSMLKAFNPLQFLHEHVSIGRPTYKMLISLQRRRVDCNARVESSLNERVVTEQAEADGVSVDH